MAKQRERLSLREQLRVETLESVKRALKINALSLGYLREQRVALLDAKKRLGKATPNESPATSKPGHAEGAKPEITLPPETLSFPGVVGGVEKAS